MDPQSHCAAGLGIPEKRIDLDVTDALCASPSAALDLSKLIWKPSRNLDLIPSRMRLAGLEALRGGLADQEDRHGRLAAILARVADNYDICLIDCSPAIGLLTYNALAASSTALIPVETSFFSLQGASRQVSTVRSMARHLSLHVRTWLVATLHDPGSGLASDLLDELNRRFGEAVCPHTIRHDPRLKEAASIGKTIVQYAPESMGAEDYAMVAAWLRPKLYTRIAEPVSEPVQAGEHAVAPPLPPHLAPSLAESLGSSLATPSGVAFESEHSDRPSGIVQVVATVESSALAQRLAGRQGVTSAAPSNPAAKGDVVAKPQGSVPEAAGTSSGVAEQIAADLRARAATRSEEMARLAQRLSGRGGGPTAHGGVPCEQAPSGAEVHGASLSLIQEIKPEQGSPPVNLSMGVRQTSQGMLFVLPMTLGESVAIAADFNGWSATRHTMKRNNELGLFELCIPLPPGRYTYRLVIDGRWQTDPFNPVTEPNPFGEANSVVTVGERIRAS